MTLRNRACPDGCRDCSKLRAYRLGRYRGSHNSGLSVRRQALTPGDEREACIKAHNNIRKAKEADKTVQDQNRKLQLDLRREAVLDRQSQARLNTESASLRAMIRHARTQKKLILSHRQ